MTNKTLIAILFVVVAVISNLVAVVAVNMFSEELKAKPDEQIKWLGFSVAIAIGILVVVLVCSWKGISELATNTRIWVAIFFVTVSIVSTQLCLAFAKNFGIALPVGIAALIAVVLLAAMAFDYYGWPNVPKRSIEWQEFLGIIVILIGVGIAAWGQTVADGKSKVLLETEEQSQAVREENSG